VHAANEAAEAVFWVSAFLVFFSYLGIQVALAAGVGRRRPCEATDPSSVTIITTIKIREKRIKDKMKTAVMVYPKEKLQILVAWTARRTAQRKSRIFRTRA
jgi:hypothetical protein